MELTATNRSQAYPKTEKGGCGYAKAEGSTKWFRTGERRHIALRSKGIEGKCGAFFEISDFRKDADRSNRKGKKDL